MLYMDHDPLQMTFLRAGPMTFIIKIGGYRYTTQCGRIDRL